MRREAKFLPLYRRFQCVIVGEIMKTVQIPIRNPSFSSGHVKKRAKIVQNERGHGKFYCAHVVPTPIKTNPYQLSHRPIFQLVERKGICSRFSIFYLINTAVHELKVRVARDCFMGGYFYGDVGSYTFSATYCLFFEEGICKISVF